jgi:DNA-binding NarL/FixJ family response regulator
LLQVYSANEEKGIGVLLVDDRPTVRRGLRMWLEVEPEVSVVGEAADGEEAVSLAEKLRPDVVLMDVKMPGVDGIEATGKLQAVDPCIAVVILSLYDDIDTRARARNAGAAAFVAKHRIKPELLVTIRRLTLTQGGAP